MGIRDRIFTVWFTGIRITDPGMSPTLYPGDVVLFDKLSMHLSMPKRGEAYALSLIHIWIFLIRR